MWIPRDAFEEFAVRQTVLGALLRLHKPQDLGQRAISLGGGQYLPLDLLVSVAPGQVVQDHVVGVVGLNLAHHALHLEFPSLYPFFQFQMFYRCKC